MVLWVKRQMAQVKTKKAVSKKLPPKTEEKRKKPERIFLVVIDSTEEMRRALYYACTRATHTDGRIALLYVRPKAEIQPWSAVNDLMREKNREEAEENLKKISARVQKWAGSLPVFYMREGNVAEEMVKLIDEEKSVTMLVLAASSGKSPGHLVNYIFANVSKKLRIPVTIIPATLSEKQIADMA